MSPRHTAASRILPEKPSIRRRILLAVGTKLTPGLIRWYIDTFEEISQWQRSKQAQLEFLERHSIGDVDALKLSTPSRME